MPAALASESDWNSGARIKPSVNDLTKKKKKNLMKILIQWPKGEQQQYHSTNYVSLKL